MNAHASFQKHALRVVLAYLLCRVASLNLENITHEWTGFIPLLTSPRKVRYFAVIDSSATELATVNEFLKRSISISKRLESNTIVNVLDEVIFAKAQTIR